MDPRLLRLVTVSPPVCFGFCQPVRLKPTQMISSFLSASLIFKGHGVLRHIPAVPQLLGHRSKSNDASPSLMNTQTHTHRRAKVYECVCMSVCVCICPSKTTGTKTTPSIITLIVISCSTCNSRRSEVYLAIPIQDAPTPGVSITCVYQCDLVSL